MELIHAALFIRAALVLVGAWAVFDLWIGAEIDRLGEE